MNNKKLIGIIVAAIGLVLIVVGCILTPNNNKVKKTPEIKEFTINGEFVTKMGDSLLVSDGEKYGYYDINGKKVLDLKYAFDWDNYFERIDAKDGMFVVTDNGVEYGIVDASEKVIISNSYSAIKIISKNCFLVRDDNLSWSVVDAKNKKIIDKTYDSVTVVNNIGAILTKDNKNDIIDVNGNKISKSEYTYVVDYDDSNANNPILIGQIGNDKNDLFIFTSDKYKIIEGVGSNYFINDNYLYYSSDGTNFSSYEFKTGKIKNKVTVDFSVNGMNMFVGENGLLGYKSADEKTVIKEQYQLSISNEFTKYGVAVVGKDDLQGVINNKGDTILPCKYKKILVFSDKLFAVRDGEDSLYYLVDEKGTKIYEKVDFDSTINNEIIVYDGEKCGVIDNYNKKIFDVKYESCSVYTGMVAVREGSNWLIRKGK